jgi:hypothetical protein
MVGVEVGEILEHFNIHIPLAAKILMGIADIELLMRKEQEAELLR